MVECLLRAGAAPDVRDKRGDTAETWALEWENYKSAMLLADAAKKKGEAGRATTKAAAKEKASSSGGYAQLALMSFDEGAGSNEMHNFYY